MLKNKVGRPLKFKQQTSVIGVRVPTDNKLLYKIEIDKTVSKLAKERGDLKQVNVLRIREGYEAVPLAVIGWADYSAGFKKEQNEFRCLFNT